MERHDGLPCGQGGRKDAGQSAVQPHDQHCGKLLRRPFGRNHAGRRPRRRTGGRHQLHAAHRTLRGHAPPARRRAVGISVGAGAISARSVPLRGGRRGGGIHALLRGPHRYYALQTGRESAGRRITLSLRLAPHEFESLFTPGTGAPDLRSAFLLDTGEGTVRAALRAVEDYDPQAASVRCTFTQLPDA